MSNETPAVSVIVPAYNSGPWIAQAVSSVLGQNLTDFELLVVDDGSVDDTVQIVETFTDSRLRLIQCPHAGQSAASNVGASEARGHFLKFLDADDVLMSGHLMSQIAVADSSKNHLVSCRWGYFRDDPSSLKPRVEAVQRDFDDPLDWVITSLTQDEGMMGVWMWLIPRSIWQRAGGFNESLTLNKDFDLSIRLLLASAGVRFAADAIYGYRKGMPEAVTQSRSRQSMESALQTTELGIAALLTREDSSRIRRLAADRMQMWLYRFFPDFPDLAMRAEQRVQELGGSAVQLQGGVLLRLLIPVFGWRAVRRLQSLAVKCGWGNVQRWKQGRKLRSLH